MQPYFGHISIDVDGQIVRAHKDILSCHSPVFATMFSAAWFAEGTRVINIHNFDFETILSMVEYIYFGDKDEYQKPMDATELIKAADMYQLAILKSKCEQWLCSSLNKNNVVGRLALSNTYDLSQLKIEALSFPNGTHSKNYN